MFSFRIAFLDLLGQVIDRAKKKITRQIMIANAARVTSGPTISENDSKLFCINNLHMVDIQDLHRELEFLVSIEHNSHIVETLKGFTEKLIWTDHEKRGAEMQQWK